MQLLSAPEVRRSKLAERDERAKRVATLHQSETKLIERINKLRDFEREHAERVSQLSKELSSYETQIETKENFLRSEIEGTLDANKEKFKTLEKDQAEARDRLAYATYKEKEIGGRFLELEDREGRVQERFSVLNDLELRYNKMKENLDETKKTFEEEKKRTLKKLRGDREAVAREADALISEKKEFFEEVSVTKKELEVAERQNTLDKKRNQEEAQHLADERRALRDGYAALEQAKKHLNL